MRFNFSKMHGLGNDFMVIDAINQFIDLSAEQVRFLADRHFGVGFDQLLLVEKPVSSNADFKYRIFNADGSEVAQCGNGARCFARFVRDKGLTEKDDIVVDTNSGQLSLHVDTAGMITVNMGIPRHAPEQIPLLIQDEALVYKAQLEECHIEFSAVSMGNPHAVIRVEDVSVAPLEAMGARMECHPWFPERVNVGFMQILNPRQIKLRVYERGAAETLACGSGACAAVVVGVQLGLLECHVSVSLPGGKLDIAWEGRGHPVFMTGPAVTVYEGQIEI